MNDIDNITNAWGKWITAQYGTTCWFTESTQYGRNKDTKNYMQHQTNVTPPQDLVYSNAVQSDGGAALLGKYDVENGTSQIIQHEVNLQQGIEDSFTWNVTENVKLGVSVKLKAGVPFMGAETTLSTELSLSSMQGSTITKTSNYGASVKVPIAPQTHSWGQINLSFTDIATSWVGNVKMAGCVAVWFNKKVALNNDGDYHFLWFVPIQSVFNDCIRNNIIDTRGYIVQWDGVIAQANGKFHSSRGLDMKVIAYEKPLNAKRQLDDVQVIAHEFYTEYRPIPAEIE